jgi:hypothetical protein
MRVRAHVRCRCTHSQADPCRDGRERDDLVIRCRCGPGGCVSDRRPKSTRASSNLASKCVSEHVLTSWPALRTDLGCPLLGLACRAQRTSLGRPEGLLCGFCRLPREAGTVGRMGSSRATPFSRSARNAAHATSARGWSGAAAHGHLSRWLTSPCVVLRVCACSATVLACSSSQGNSNIRATSSTAPASLLRAHSCSTLLSASPAAPLAALLCACSLQFRCSNSQTRVRLFYPLSSIREDSSWGSASSDHLGARTCVARASSVAPSVLRLCPFDCGFPDQF